MIRTLILSACAALSLIGLVSSPSSASGVPLPMSPVGAPELTAASFNAYSSSFDTTKGKEIGEEGMLYFSLLSPDGAATVAGSNSYSGKVTVTEAPEVSTWAMMLVGFAGLGFMGSLARKRRGADPIGL